MRTLMAAAMLLLAACGSPCLRASRAYVAQGGDPLAVEVLAAGLDPDQHEDIGWCHRGGGECTRVDRVAWAQRARRRLDGGLRELEDRVGAARSALASHRALVAYELALAGSAAGLSLEPDVLLSDVLAEPSGARNADRPIRVAISLGQHYLRTDRVANRSEYVHAASGEVSVRDADGSPLERLGLVLPSERYVERDVVQDAAARKALMLSADAVASGFRRAFREAFPAQM